MFKKNNNKQTNKTTTKQTNKQKTELRLSMSTLLLSLLLLSSSSSLLLLLLLSSRKEKAIKCVKEVDRENAVSYSTDRWRQVDSCLLVGCLTSQQHASVSQGRICSDNFTCCHTEIEVADPTFYLTQSQYTDTGPTSPSADPITPGAWQGSQWSANF